MPKNYIVCYYGLLELALALLPNAEDLHLEVTFNYGIPAEKSLRAPFAMKSVRRLHLNPSTMQPLDLGQLSGFLANMPCLQTLEVEKCEMVSQSLPLAELRSLTITESKMNATSLKRLINSCPGLEHFACRLVTIGFSQTYGPGEHPFTWGEVQRTLYLRKKTLKHLDLSCLYYSPNLSGTPLTSFRDFEVLETLWVQTTGWGTIISGRVITPAFTGPGLGPEEMLPASLACLGLCGPHDGWHGLSSLADAIRGGHFPKLKTIMVEHDSPQKFESAKRILAGAGVVCGHVAPWLYSSFPKCRYTEFLLWDGEGDWDEKGKWATKWRESAQWSRNFEAVQVLEGAVWS
ncbi:hypothetical protein V8C35DRAFT_301190 [Trichoderma chlorosporum]